MIKSLFSLLLLLPSGLALAGATCADIPGEQRHAPLKIEDGEDGVVCFVEGPSEDENGEEFVIAISPYYIRHGHQPVKAQGRLFPYDYDTGEIVDAFLLDIDHDGKKEVVVIHYHGVRTSQAEPNSSGYVYSVMVYNLIDHVLRFDERSDKWFGSAYSWNTNENGFVYKYPFMTKESVIQAVNSPLASLMFRDETKSVIVKKKSYLYSFPYLDARTKKYLIAGDKGTVDKSELGLCRITYTGGKEPLQMWMKCDDLELDTGK